MNLKLWFPSIRVLYDAKYIVVTACIMFTLYYVCIFVDCCLATKVFIGKLPAICVRDVRDPRVGQ